MKFRTEIKLKPQQENIIDHESKVLLLGSCFSENIGNKLSYYQFDVLTNPFGVLFSPTAIAKVIDDTVTGKVYSESDLIKHGELYHSLHHHSDFSGLNSTQVIENIHTAQQNCLAQLEKATHVIITLGTSWVYEYLETNELVANCHKIPQQEFNKRILSVDEIEIALNDIVTNIRKVNSSTQIIFTLSPVRHTKNGLVENSLSKAMLLTATGKIIKGGDATYFPSYEMMMDDLRDYRFYEADMIHPNKVAIDYIWEQFSKVWISEQSQNYFKRIASVQQGLLHKPFESNSQAHQQFLEKLEEKKKQLAQDLNRPFHA